MSSLGLSKPSKAGSFLKRRNQHLTPNQTTRTGYRVTQVTPIKVDTTVQIESDLALIAKIDEGLPGLRITGSRISTLSYEDTKALAIIEITNPSIMDPGGLMSKTMGPTTMNEPCPTCGKITNCPGHYGYINLARNENPATQIYIFNPLFGKIAARVLNSICRHCYRLRLPPDYLKEQGIFMLRGYARLKKIAEISIPADCMADRKSEMKCGVNARFTEGKFKKTGELRYRDTDTSPVKELTAKEAFEILDRLSQEDAMILGFDEYSHPRDFILRNILVPPPIARPPDFYEGKWNQDTFTIGYSQIYHRAQKAIETQSKGAIDDLFLTVSAVFVKKGETNSSGHQNMTSIGASMSKKDGFIRENMTGKRINQCARTVLVGDTEVNHGEISIPRLWSQKLTRQEVVTHYNRNALLQLLKDRRIYYVITGTTGERKYRPSSLKVGDIAEVRIEDGAFVTLGRQPTLSPESIMGMNIVLKDRYTIGIRMEYTTPYNADFDGDEGHVEIPQGAMAEVELRELVHVSNNYLRSGGATPNMGLPMNGTIASYLLSDPHYQLPAYLFQILTAPLKEIPDNADFLQRCYDLNVNPFSSRALYSKLLPRDFFYHHAGVEILNGMLMEGRLSKKHIGASTRSIIHDLVKYYGKERTSTFFTNADRLINDWLGEAGFSVGESDLSATAIDDESGKRIEVNKHIMSRKITELHLALDTIYQRPIDENNSLDREIRQQQILEAIYALNSDSQLLATAFTNNRILDLSSERSGTKGDITNISKMTTVIGQYYLRGSTVAVGDNGRTLPSFEVGSRDPRAYGLVLTSYSQGQSPSGNFFGHMTTRDALTDTSIRTPVTGYLQRNLIATTENVTISEEGSVVDYQNNLIASQFNGGIDIRHAMGSNSPIDIRPLVDRLNARYGWIPTTTPLGTDQRTRFQDYYRSQGITGISSYQRTAHSVPFADRLAEYYPSIVPCGYHLTVFEKCVAIGTRAKMLDRGSVPRVDVIAGSDYRSRSSVDIAYREYDAALYDQIGLSVIRTHPDRTIEIIPLTPDRILPPLRQNLTGW